MHRITFRTAICSSLAIVLAITVFASEAEQEAEEPPSNCYTGSIPTDELVQLMNNKSWTTCIFVAELAAERGTEATQPLLNMFLHGDGMVQAAAWEAIRKIKDPHAIPVLIESLEHKDRRDRFTESRASWALRELGSPAVEPLLEVLEQRTGDDRLMTIETLGGIDDSRAVQALQEIVSSKDDPHWKETVRLLAMKEGDIGYSILKLADSDRDVREIVSTLWPIGHRDDRRLLPLYFERAKLENETLSQDGMLGIARNAGRAELPRIFEEGLDKTWVLPFVQINAATEGIEPESAKAGILWPFVLTLQYRYFPDIRESNPITYAMERLAKLGDAALPILEEGMKSENRDVRVRAIMTLTQTLPSEASTELLLKAWDAVEWDNDEELRLCILGFVVEELAGRRERRTVPKIVRMLPTLSVSGGFDLWDAAEALGEISDRTVLPEMVKTWENLDITLAKWGEDEKRWKEMMKSQIAGAFAKAMSNLRIADPSSIPILVNAMSSPQSGDGPYGGLYDHRVAALLTLVRIGEPSIEPLKQLSESEDGLNRELAETALKILQWSD